MSLTKITFTKDWTNPSDFPTIETSETAVRNDMQVLYNEVKSGVNTIVDQLEGTSGATNTGVTPITGVSGSNVQDALQSLKDQVDLKAATSALQSHTSNTSNPHSVTKAQVGLGNVDNTSDANKTVKEAGKVTNALTFGQKTFDGSAAKEIVKADIGLGNVDNTSDANKPISTATSAALALKESVADANLLIKNVTYTSADGKFTFTKQGGGTIVVDTNLEKVPGSMALVEDPVGSGTYYLVIYDTSVPPVELSRCPVSALFNAINVEDTSTINLVLASDTAGKKKLTANVKDGSITFAKLASAVQSRITTLEGHEIDGVTDTSTIDLEISSKKITASVKNGSIGATQLDSAFVSRVSALEDNAITGVTDTNSIDLDIANHKITASVKNGGITSAMLEAGLYSDIEGFKDDAETAATNASASAVTAGGYATTAGSKATEASGYADNASASATAASGFSGAASSKATEAAGYANAASGSANSASNYATTASGKATLSESWAVGGTGTRTGEDTNNAKYWCEQASAAVSADMKKSVYDPTLSVQQAGGIPAYVNANGGKIDKIKVNGTEQAIVSKVVDLAVYEKPASGIPSTDMTSAVQTSLGKADTALQSSALTPYRTASAQDAIDLAMQNDIDAIEGKIPSEATSSNQLADKSFVNSSISTNTATFRGTSASGLTEAQFLEWANGLTKTNNDYVFWNTVDANNNVVYKRYKYNGTEWVYEYSLNNSSFTAAQWSTINSGITSDKVSGYDTHIADSIIHVTSSDKSTWNGKVSCTDATVGSFGYTKNVGTITGINMNGASKGTSGVVDLGTVLTSHQDISGKADKQSITAGTAGTSSATSGATLAVPYVTMTSQGVVSGYGTHTHTISGLATSAITSGTFADARIASASTWNAKQSQHSTTTATLGNTGWSSNQKTISVSGVTASNTVIVSPAPASVSVWTTAQVYCSAQASGTLTFTCSSTPSASMTVNVVILN